MGEFALQPDDGLVTGSVLRAEFGVSRQTLHNWRKQGMPTAGTRGNDTVYDLAACKRWKDEHHPTTGHGGTRPGAGAPPKPTEPAGQATLDDARAQAQAEENSAVDLSSPDSIVESIHSGRITPKAAKISADLLQAAVKRLELDFRQGKLVDRAEAANAYGEHLAAVKMRLDALPSQLAAALVGLLGLTPEQGRLVHAEVERRIVELERALATGPSVTQPELAA